MQFSEFCLLVQLTLKKNYLPNSRTRPPMLKIDRNWVMVQESFASKRFLSHSQDPEDRWFGLRFWFTRDRHGWILHGEWRACDKKCIFRVKLLVIFPWYWIYYRRGISLVRSPEYIRWEFEESEKTYYCKHRPFYYFLFSFGCSWACIAWRL